MRRLRPSRMAVCLRLAIQRKALRFGDVLTNFVRLFGLAGISQQMLKLSSTRQIKVDQRISR